MEGDEYFAFCFFPSSKRYSISASEHLKPRTRVSWCSPGLSCDTLGDEFWGAVFQSAWHPSFEVDPDNGAFLDADATSEVGVQAQAHYQDCLVLATASTVEQLQNFIEKCSIKVPKPTGRRVLTASLELATTETLGTLPQKNEALSPEQEISAGNVQGASEGSDKSGVSSAPIDELVIQGKIQGKPRGPATLGFFKYNSDGKIVIENADDVFVLVVHYDFRGTKDFRQGDAADVDNLKRTFGENRNCNFRELRSPKIGALLQLLSEQERLLQYFASSDVPSVFVLFVLSHGGEYGKIATDHPDREDFTAGEIIDAMKKLPDFDQCLKLFNFGPCRGELADLKYDEGNSYEKYKNRNSCRVTFQPDMHNSAVIYSTVETTLANTDGNGSWFVRKFCDRLNGTEERTLFEFLTLVQHQTHLSSRAMVDFGTSEPLGQTPEVKLFTQDKVFTFAKSLISQCTSSKSDAKASNTENMITSVPGFYEWKSDERKNIRGRQAFILFERRTDDVKAMENALRLIDFDVQSNELSEKSVQSYFADVCALEHDVGCVWTCIFGAVCENGGKEVCVLVEDKEKPITDFLHGFVGPKNVGLIGKPKIFTLVDQLPVESDKGTAQEEMFKISATNHSGWLALILQDADDLKKLVNVIESDEIREDKNSLQELLETVLVSQERKNRIFLNSTLHFLLNFPVWPRSFVEPELRLKTGECLSFYEFSNRARKAFEESQVFIFCSVCGSGKTTVLKELAHRFAKIDQQEIKVLKVSLRKHALYTLQKTRVEEIEYLAETTRNPPVDVRNWIEQKRAAVFFEGFEAIRQEVRVKVVALLDKLNARKIPFCLQTRPNDELEIIKDVSENAIQVEIQPFDDEKQLEFLQTVAGKSKEESQRLVGAFEGSTILGNPLLLSHLAKCNDLGNLYRVFDDVVKQIVKSNLERRNDEGAVAQEKMEKACSRLQLAALRLTKGHPLVAPGLTDKDLRKINKCGIATFSNGRISFLHQSIADFLATKQFLEDAGEIGCLDLALFDKQMNLSRCRKFADLFFSALESQDESGKFKDALTKSAAQMGRDNFLVQAREENLVHIYEIVSNSEF